MAATTSSRILVKRLIPGLLLGFFVFLGLAILGDLRHVSESILAFDWRIYPLALLFTLFNYTLRFLKWHYYLKLIGASNISWKLSLRMFVAGFPLAVTPGKVGEVLKGVWLNRLSGIPVGKGISVVVAERISDGMAVLLLSLVGVIAYPKYWPAFLLVFVLLVGMIVLSQIRPAAMFILDQLEKIKLLKKIIVGTREFYEGSYSLFKPVPTLIAVSLGTISWLGEGIGFYLILTGLGLQPGLHLASMAVFILAFSTIVGAVTALPGGLGAAEVSIAGMLTVLMVASPSEASAATLLIRLATLWFGVILGLIAWAFSADLLGMKAEQAHDVEN
ncbi:MAG: flippase-like domain-containing protein [Anaerolineaceae bacterium]|nr:flippase-like domain-containing protein [Anaerolineaceae bacterium]NTV35625.1 flippase-like domain-containing protein [Anaerolineaceae bacterium]